jgi:hypothetical protein
MSTEWGKSVGIVGTLIFVFAWLTLGAAPSLLPPPWVPRIWLLAIALALPCAVIAGVVAGRMTSRWWYLLSAAGLISVAFLLANVAV